MGKATYTVTVTNNSNGVSVDYETETPMTLLVPEVAATKVGALSKGQLKEFLDANLA